MGNTNVPAVLLSLTPRERDFAIQYVKLGSAEAAKKLAGYADSVNAHYLSRHPGIAAAIQWELRRVMATEGASVGLGSLLRIARDTKAPAAAQVAAAKALLQGAGMLDAPDSAKDAKDIKDMSRDELRDYIESKRAEVEKLEASLAAGATDITPTPDKQTPDIFT